ncbi:MAG TPA: hypothetical protein VGR58_11190 [Candidatus Acidoferrum sp.]|nr:hypothetical protein [Candidatus Acidoferrum sp.]
MNKSTTRIWSLLIWIAFWQSSCGTGRQSGCEKHIKEEIHAGMPSEMAVDILKKCGFKTTVDPAKKALYGDKRVEDSLIVERTQILINLDSDDRVAAVTVTTGLIGP